MNPEEISLRTANEDDFPAIKALIREGGINPMGLEWQRFLVAVNHKDEVIGCAQIKPHRDGSQELSSLVVTKSWRQLGIAKRLMEKLMGGYSGDLYLICESSLGPLYQKFQFEGISEDEMPKYFRRISKLVGFVEPLIKKGQTLLVMKRIL